MIHSRKMLPFAALVLGAALLLGGCGGGDDAADSTAQTGTDAPAAHEAQPAASTTVGAMAPDFALKDLDGETVKLSDFRGDVVILDFWATWCPPCKKAMPHLQEIHDEHAGDGIRVLAVSTDRQGAAIVQPFAAENGYTMKILLANEALFHAYSDIQSIPTTFVITPEGKIAYRFVGYRDKGTYLTAAEKARETEA